MAFKTDADNLWQEVQAAEKKRDRHLKHVDEMTRRFVTPYYCEDYKANKPVIENYAFELWSILKPSLIYSSPQAVLSCASPDEMDDDTAQQIFDLMNQTGAQTEYQLAQMYGYSRLQDFVAAMGGTTMGQVTRGLQLAINRWATNNRVYTPLLELALDYYFCFGVGYVTTGDQPGRQSFEMAPQQPYIVRIPSEHLVLDSGCMSASRESTNGPRFIGHPWKADHDDLLNEDGWDREAVQMLGIDIDLQRYDLDRRDGRTADRPKRREIVAYDLWVPDDGFSQMELKSMGVSDYHLYNGAWHTIAVATDGGATSKKARTIRPRRPAYVPAWGPYVMFGYHEVRNSPYYLSLVIATAERAESLNEHLEAASEDARSYKKLLLGRSNNPKDAETARSARNGSVVLFDSADPKNELASFEVGGVSQTQMQWIREEEDHLMRVGGVSSTRMGETQKRVSATAESIADAGIQSRTSGFTSGFRAGLTQLYRTAAHYMFHGDDQAFNLGEEGARAGIPKFIGGTMGRSRFSFEDIAVTIDPYSMEHTNGAMIQKRMLDLMTWFRDTAPVMAQTPYIGWRDMADDLLKVLNINGAGRWLDPGLLAQAQQIQASSALIEKHGAQQKPNEMQPEDPEALADQYLAEAGGGDAMAETQSEANFESQPLAEAMA